MNIVRECSSVPNLPPTVMRLDLVQLSSGIVRS